MRGPALLLIALVLAGCTGDPTPAPTPAVTPDPGTPALRMLALDGRWPFPEPKAAALLASVGAPAHEGLVVFAEARAARAVADVVGLDTRAAARLDTAAPAVGEALVTRSFAEREDTVAGSTLALAAASWPAPYVATYFEMERTPACERRPEAKLCFLPEIEAGTARLRLRADEGARDAGFLPDLVELGPQGRPAWWNGTFASPSGNVTPFLAYAGLDGTLVPAEQLGPMEAGEWTISFRLEANGRLAPSGAAGIVRVREPGFLWFDDRLQEVTDPTGQARAVLANATPTSLSVRVAGVVDALPAGADVLLAYDDARALAGAAGPTAVLATLTPADERALGAARAADGVTTALRPRAIPERETRPPADPASALVFAAPADLDPASLPAVDGALAPSLSLAGRAGVGEPFELDGERVARDTLLLALAKGDAPWSLPAGGRWTQVADALDNLSRSRTLALASSDLLAAPIATMRVEMGDGNTTRSLVAIGGVEGGPERALWTSAALVAGAGHPVSARLVVPLATGATRADVAERALAAWADHGVVLDR